MTKDEVLKLALEALEGALSDDQPYIKKSEKAVEALRQALEQTDQGPDAWWCGGSVSTRKGYFEEMGWGPIKPLYTSPPSKPWVSLTDQKIDELDEKNWGEDRKSWGIHEFARAIEAALKEKNHD